MKRPDPAWMLPDYYSSKIFMILLYPDLIIQCFIWQSFFLLGKGLSFSKHSAVIAAFGKEFVKSGNIPEEYHRYLIDGESRRNISDYDINSGMTQLEAEEQIDRAEKFLELAEKYI